MNTRYSNNRVRKSVAKTTGKARKLYATYKHTLLRSCFLKLLRLEATRNATKIARASEQSEFEIENGHAKPGNHGKGLALRNEVSAKILGAVKLKFICLKTF